MKEMKINFNPELFQECGRVPVFNENNASILHTIVAIPFGKKCEPERMSIPYKSIPSCEEQYKAGDLALIKAICRHQPMKLPRELYEMDIQTVQTVELKLD